MSKLKSYKVTANYANYVAVSEAAKRKPITQKEWIAEQGSDEIIQTLHVRVAAKPESPYTVTEVADKDIDALVETVNAHNAKKQAELEAWLAEQDSDHDSDQDK